MSEMRGCEAEGWEMALNEARESETIRKMLVFEGSGSVSIC